MSKVRLDVLVHRQSLAASREKARVLIQAGLIMVNGQRVDKPGTLVADDSELKIHGERPRYVSRGGLKLEKALGVFEIDCENKVILDVGASTGGYTDCVLQNGARQVYAVDVGYGQLDWTLRNDPRVINLERTNIRHLSRREVPEQVDIVLIDVSFISTALVFPAIMPWLHEQSQVICLIKPQFEAPDRRVLKKGVIKDPKVHMEIIRRVLAGAAGCGLYCWGLTYSPIKGPKGNIEFWALFSIKPRDTTPGGEHSVVTIVGEAHQQLGSKK